MINTDRLILEFKTLLSIESPSLKEGKVAHYLADLFDALGYPIYIDKSAEHTNSDVGNLIIKIPGTIERPTLLFCAHLDTVGPYENPEIIEEGEIIKTNGKTILGADDKAGIAILVELAKVLRENPFPHPPLEFVFTTAEEIGLLGAKYLDYTLLNASYGFVLDAENPSDVIIAAPSSYQFILKVFGKSAHAGIEPERGINAIKLLAQIVVNLPTGRVDHETTINIGKINGGNYVNIVPDLAFTEGEMRSHSEEKLEVLRKEIENITEDIIKNYFPKIENLPSYQLDFKKVFKAFKISEEEPFIQWIKEAAKNLGMCLDFKIKEGGSDANILNEKGIKSVILGTGMQRVHTTDEFIKKSDLIKASHLVLEIIKIAGKNPF
ncbi:MAG: M20/M25/M40 family metallo-hydrolase [Caldimicrobium sp.]